MSRPAAERALGRGALDVDVDPLVVVGGVGEQVHAVLGDLEPVAGAPLGAVQAGTSERVVVVVLWASRWSGRGGGAGRACGSCRWRSWAARRGTGCAGAP